MSIDWPGLIGCLACRLPCHQGADPTLSLSKIKFCGGDCSCSLSCFFNQASPSLDNVALPCYQTEMLLHRSISPLPLHARNSEYSQTHTAVACCFCSGWTGRPVRVRRQSTLVTGIRNFRAHGCLMHTAALLGPSSGRCFEMVRSGR